MDRLTNDVIKLIRKEKMLKPGAAVLIGFSGGADSVCLLHILSSVRALLKINVCAVHVNHQLRGDEALRDELFCRMFAEKHKIPFYAERIDVLSYKDEHGLSLEEAARILRYELLEEKRAELSAEFGGTEAFIATAHHADDQAETILMNMLRGSGLKGLGGMRPARDRIVRPLIAVTKKDILDYISRNGLDFVTDSTNLCNDYTRNRIRNEIIPKLNEEVNQQASRHIVAAGELCREADDYFTALASEYINTEAEYSEDGLRLRLNQKVLKEKAKIIRRYVIIEALRSFGIPLKDWGERHFDDIDGLLFKNKGAHVDLPGQISAYNEYKETILVKEC